MGREVGAGRGRGAALQRLAVVQRRLGLRVLLVRLARLRVLVLGLRRVAALVLRVQQEGRYAW